MPRWLCRASPPEVPEPRPYLLADPPPLVRPPPLQSRGRCSFWPDRRLNSGPQLKTVALGASKQGRCPGASELRSGCAHPGFASVRAKRNPGKALVLVLKSRGCSGQRQRAPAEVKSCAQRPRHPVASVRHYTGAAACARLSRRLYGCCWPAAATTAGLLLLAARYSLLMCGMTGQPTSCTWCLECGQSQCPHIGHLELPETPSLAPWQASSHEPRDSSVAGCCEAAPRVVRGGKLQPTRKKAATQVQQKCHRPSKGAPVGCCCVDGIRGSARSLQPPLSGWALLRSRVRLGATPVPQ